MFDAGTWRRQWFPLAFALVAVAGVVPLVWFRALPGQDVPNHFAIVEALARRGDAGWGELFASRLGLGGYSGFYLLATALAAPFGADVACRLLLALYVVGLPLSVLYFARAVGDADRDGDAARWAGLLAFAFVYGDAYLVGFAPFLLSLPVVFLAGGVAVRAVRQTRGRWPRVVALAVLGLAGYALHPMGAALLVGVAGGAACLFAGQVRAVALVAAALAPTVAALGALAVGGEGGVSAHLTTSFKIDYWLRTPVFIADAMPGWLWLSLAGLPALVLAGSLLVAGYARLGALVRERARPCRGSVGWLAAGLFGVYLAAPFRIGNTIWFDLRLASVAWLLVCVAAAPVIARGVVTRVVAACLIAAMSASALAAHAGFEREVAPLFELIDRMEPGRRVLPIVADASSDSIVPIYQREQVIGYYTPHAHFGSYYHVAKGGASPLMAFDDVLPWIPLVVRAPAWRDHFHLTDPFNAYHVVSELDTTAAMFDYLLVRGADARMTRVIERHAHRIARVGRYDLFAPGAGGDVADPPPAR